MFRLCVETYAVFQCVDGRLGELIDLLLTRAYRHEIDLDIMIIPYAESSSLVVNIYANSKEKICRDFEEVLNIMKQVLKYNPVHDAVLFIKRDVGGEWRVVNYFDYRNFEMLLKCEI